MVYNKKLCNVQPVDVDKVFKSQAWLQNNLEMSDTVHVVYVDSIPW